MKQRYRIWPEGRPPEPTDAKVARYATPERLLYNQQHAKHLLHRTPLYKDPKAFFAFMIFVLLAWYIPEVVDKEQPLAPAPSEQPVP